jgi:hypothetical protein
MTTQMRTGALALRRRAAITLVLVLGLAVLGGPASASSHKRFTLDVTPAAVVGGQAGQAFTATLTNHSSQQQLGSADVTVPSGFTLESVTSPPTVNGVARGTATRQGNVIRLRNLSTPPGGTAAVSFTATTACAAGDYDFDAHAKQANNFSGPPGNDLDFDAQASARTVTVTSGCAVALRFVAGSHPADAEKGAVISSSPFDPDGPPVLVEAVDAAGTRATGFTGTVTVDLDDNPTSTVLGGTTTVSAELGVAAFDDLTVAVAGVGYTLEATSQGLQPAASGPFNVYDDACAPGDTCRASAGDLDPVNGGQTSTAYGTAGASGGGLIVNVDHTVQLNCGAGLLHAPATTTLIGDGLQNKVAEILIAKEIDQSDTNNGVAHYQVCAEPLDEASQFLDRDGNLVLVGHTGLLPDCGPPGRKAPPCVDSRTKTGSGDVLITILWGSRLRVF